MRVTVARGMRGLLAILVHVRMDVRQRAVLMPVRVEIAALPAHEQPHRQSDDRQADDGLGGALRHIRQTAAEEDDRQTEEEQRDRMAKAPEKAQKPCTAAAPVVVGQDQRGNRGEVIGIRRVPRAEQHGDGERQAEAAATEVQNPLIKTGQSSRLRRRAPSSTEDTEPSDPQKTERSENTFRGERHDELQPVLHAGARLRRDLEISIPGRTFRMLAVGAARLHSTTSARSTCSPRDRRLTGTRDGSTAD
jgi:hypothetical protein